MDELSPGERALGWLRAELGRAASRPALVLAILAVAGSLAVIASAIADSVAFGGGFRGHLLVAVSGFGLTCQVILVVASLLVLADGLAGNSENGRGPIWFYGLAVLGGLGVVANLMEMTSLLTEAGIPPASAGVGTLTEFYAYTVFISIAPALMAVVPVYVGLTGARLARSEVTVAHVE